MGPRRSSKLSTASHGKGMTSVVPWGSGNGRRGLDFVRNFAREEHDFSRAKGRGLWSGFSRWGHGMTTFRPRG